MKRPTAAQRTVSLFTGKTDLEDPQLARDGTEPEIRDGERPIKPLKWDGGVARWAVPDGPRGESYVVEKKGEGRYEARFFAQRIGTFDTVMAAGEACEEHYRRRRR